jgi:hypothetical protein
MASKRNQSWARIHMRDVQVATQYAQHIHQEARPFDQNELQAYRKWYHKNGMASVYIFGMHVEGLAREVSVGRDEHRKSGHIPSGPLIVRNVIAFTL